VDLIGVINGTVYIALWLLYFEKLLIKMLLNCSFLRKPRNLMIKVYSMIKTKLRKWPDDHILHIFFLIVIGYLVIFLPLFQQFFYFPLVFLGCFLLILYSLAAFCSSSDQSFSFLVDMNTGLGMSCDNGRQAKVVSRAC